MEELKQYHMGEVQDDCLADNEMTTVLNIFNKTVDKIAKRQYQSLTNIDTVVDLLDDIKETDKRISLSEEKAQVLDQETQRLVKVIIEMGDLLEDIYISSTQGSNEGLKEQMQLQWNRMQQILLSHQMVCFGNVGELFDVRLHIAKETISDNQVEEIKETKLLEVIKSGYIYKGQLIRKAEVVINN